MRIIVAQHNRNITSKIKLTLLAEGFDIDTTNDGETVLWYTQEDKHALIILDVILEKINGYDVCQNIRNINRRIPILMITKNTSTTDEIDALDSGADDFLRAPFSSPVLLARVRALLRRRHQEIISDTIYFGSHCLSLKDRKCFFDRQEISLTNREYQILELLIRAEGEVIPKHTLIDQIWGIEFDGNPNIVDVYMGYLRSKLLACTNNNNIQTIRGIGYRLTDMTG